MIFIAVKHVTGSIPVLKTLKVEVPPHIWLGSPEQGLLQSSSVTITAVS